MDFDDLQKAWQSQEQTSTVTVNADLLLKHVQRDQRHFFSIIFWRDIREVGLAFVLCLFFSYQGWCGHDWSDFLIAAACLGVGTFMVFDRLIQRGKRSAPGDSLKNCLKASLTQLNHQIWLLRNVFWWYLLPIAATLILSDIRSALQKNTFPVSGFAADLILTVLIFGGVYWLNQYVVRKDLEPRRQELESLRASLEGGS